MPNLGRYFCCTPITYSLKYFICVIYKHITKNNSRKWILFLHFSIMVKYTKHKMCHFNYWGFFSLRSLFFKNCCSSTVVFIFPLPFSPAPPTPTSYPQSFPPLALSMGPLYMFLDKPSPSFPDDPPAPSLLVTVSLFFISMSLVIFCLLVCFVD